MKPLNRTPPLTNLGGGGGPDPLPMLQMEARAQVLNSVETKICGECCKGQSKYC